MGEDDWVCASCGEHAYFGSHSGCASCGSQSSLVPNKVYEGRQRGERWRFSPYGGWYIEELD